MLYVTPHIHDGMVEGTYVQTVPSRTAVRCACMAAGESKRVGALEGQRVGGGGGDTYPSKKVPHREASPGCAGVLPVKVPEGQQLVSKSLPHFNICMHMAQWGSC